MERRIAAVTEDGTHISSHFGMAPLYQVFTVQDGQVVKTEQRPKPHHAAHPDHDAQGGHTAHNHEDMFAPVRDCQVLLCGGMGQPAYQKALATGLEVVLTGGEIESAVRAYLSGQAQSDPRRIHLH